MYASSDAYVDTADVCTGDDGVGDADNLGSGAGCTYTSGEQWHDVDIPEYFDGVCALAASCTGEATEVSAACTGDNDGAGTACALNAAGDACNVEGGDCVFSAATTPVCDLDASTDGTAECLAGCTDSDCSFESAAEGEAEDTEPTCTGTSAECAAVALVDPCSTYDTTMPETEGVCPGGAECTYSWITEEYPACPADCDTPETQRTRAVTCTKDQDEEICAAIETPWQPLCLGFASLVDATCTGNANDLVTSCTGDNNGAGAACELNTAEDACNVLEDGNNCVFVAATAPASCTGTDDGTGAACELNTAEDACNVLEDGNNCVFAAATTPVCDLDASTDGTAECPAGCTDVPAYTPVCDLDDSTAPAGTAACPDGCNDTTQCAEGGNCALSSSVCAAVPMSESLCTSQRPDDTDTCPPQLACEYEWYAGEFSACPTACDTGDTEKTRTVSCVKQDLASTLVDDSNCQAGLRPSETGQCPATAACSVEWVEGTNIHHAFQSSDEKPSFAKTGRDTHRQDRFRFAQVASRTAMWCVMRIRTLSTRMSAADEIPTLAQSWHPRGKSILTIAARTRTNHQRALHAPQVPPACSNGCLPGSETGANTFCALAFPT